ncbi:MAG: hypothetical protein DRO99_01140, partial [Candidatus Aenigmatarchaeota archaeon]
MANQDILDYLSGNIKKGYSPSQLKQALMSSGYAEADIDEAMRSLGIIQDDGQYDDNQMAGAQDDSSQTQQQSAPSDQQKAPEHADSGNKKKLTIILIAISGVLIAVVALTLLGVISLTGEMTTLQAIESCDSAGRHSCYMDMLPGDWDTKKLNVEGVMQSCQDVMECDSCHECGFPRSNCTISWSCTPWFPSECPPSGSQTRSCVDTNRCGKDEGKPAEVRNCTYNPTAQPSCTEDWNCTGWS